MNSTEPAADCGPGLVDGARSDQEPAKPGAEQPPALVAVSGLTANARYAIPPQLVAHQVSAGDLAARAVSFRGSLHALTGQPRQDAFAVATSPGWLIAVVADGIGSCEHSEHGSAAAAKAVAAALALGEADPDDGRSLMEIAALACADAARELAVDANSVSSTLTVVVIAADARPDGGHHALVHSVGDSPVILLEPAERRWTYLTPRPDGPSNVVDGWIPGNHQTPFDVGLTVPAGSILVACSDGFSVPLGNGDGPLGADLARRWAAGPRDLVPFLVDLSFDAHYDDKTVVAIWNSWSPPSPDSADQSPEEQDDGQAR